MKPNQNLESGSLKLAVSALLSSIFYLLSSPAVAGTFDCQWLFRGPNSNVISISQVTIQTIAPYGVDASTVIITGDRKTAQTDSAGSLIISNLFNGRSYRVQIAGPYINTTFTNSFDTNVTGLVNGADPLYLVAPIRDTSTVAFSQAAADARFHNTSGDTSTNAVFRGTLKIPAGATLTYVWTVTNADGSGAWQPASVARLDTTTSLQSSLQAGGGANAAAIYLDIGAGGGWLQDNSGGRALTWNPSGIFALNGFWGNGAGLTNLTVGNLTNAGSMTYSNGPTFVAFMDSKTLTATQNLASAQAALLTGATNNSAITASNLAVRISGTNNTSFATNSALSGLVTNGDLSINVDAVPQLDTALRYSNQISVVIFGDSVGNYIWKSAPKLFDTFSTFPTAKSSLRYSGYNADGWGGWLNTLNSGTGPSTYDTVLDCWWGDGQIYVVSSGTSNVWSVGGTGTATGKLNGNLLKFWYLASATNGTIVVETSTDGTTYVPRIVQNEATPSRGLVCTNIALATADYYVRVSAGSGRCQYLYPQIINTNSRNFYIANLCAGGRTMVDLMNMGTNNLATLLTNMWPPTTLIAYVDTKSIYTYTNWFKVKGLFDTYSTNSDVVVGKPQPSTIASIEADTAEGTYFQSLVFNDIGRTNKIPFLDMRSSFADTNRSARLNFYANDGSGVHFNNNGQEALSDDFWLRLKIIPRLATTTNFVVKKVYNMLSVIGSTYNDTAYISNAWANGRSGLYFEAPDATAANWAIAGSSSAMGLKSRAGFYIFCNYSTTAGAQWFTSGGLNLWGSGYANNEDPGIGGLVLAGNQTNYGHFAIAAVGKKFLVKEGSNAIAGIATLSGGTVVVSTTAVTANSRIQLTPQTLGTVARPAAVGVTARSAGTSFTITSGDATDTSTVAWFIVEPAP